MGFFRHLDRIAFRFQPGVRVLYAYPQKLGLIRCETPDLQSARSIYHLFCDLYFPAFSRLAENKPRWPFGCYVAQLILSAQRQGKAFTCHSLRRSTTW